MTLGIVAPRRWRALVAALVVSIGGCTNRENIFHGVIDTEDRSSVIVAALMPSCSCTTMASTETSGDIVLVSRLHNIEVGSLVLSPGRPARFRFDWAGLTNEDVYEITAYAIENGRRGKPLTPFRDHVFVEPDVVPINCASTSCPFGPLSLDEAWAEQAGQGEAEVYEVGVHLSNGGQSIIADTLPGTCGCMVLRNITDTPLQLRSRLRGRERGQAVLPARTDVALGFDWSGDNPDDVYAIEASHVPGSAADPQPSARAASGETRSTTAGPAAVDLSDYIQIFGSFVGADCGTGDDRRQGVALVVNGTRIVCPYGTLSMGELAASGATSGPAAGLAPAPAAGAVPPPDAKAGRRP